MSCPADLDELRRVVTVGEEPTYIPRGLGRAYGDAALNRGAGVIQQTRLNRLLSLDESTGLLECEGGASFDGLIRAVLPRGWFLPTTPGTKFVTLGGAIAADIHGKNHHRVGSFGNSVVDLQLLTASGDVVTCSRTQNPDVFWATVGGMGLTGVIVRARVRLMRVESGFLNASYERAGNLDEALERLSRADDHHAYSVAWVDCLSRGRSLGRSVLMLGNVAAVADLPAPLRAAPLRVNTRRGISVPFHLPAFVLNPWSVGAFNALFYARQPSGRCVVDYDRFFYPLDRVRHWNRIYGRRGFVHYQALFPPDTSRRALIGVLEQIAASQQPAFLAVLKRAGPADSGLLSYMHPGHTLALDFPNSGAPLRELTRTLDELVLRHGGRLYLAKDSMTTAEAFAAMYPRLGEFRAVKARIDPGQRFVSSQARRLGIVDAA